MFGPKTNYEKITVQRTNLTIVSYWLQFKTIQSLNAQIRLIEYNVSEIYYILGYFLIGDFNNLWDLALFSSGKGFVIDLS